MISIFKLIYFYNIIISYKIRFDNISLTVYLMYNMSKIVLATLYSKRFYSLSGVSGLEPLYNVSHILCFYLEYSLTPIII